MAITKREYDRSTLPKWAQDELDLLHLRLAETREALVLERAGHPDALSTLRDNVHNTSRGLGPYETLRIVVGTRGRSDSDPTPRYWIDVKRTDDGRVEVYGSDMLVCYPKSTNVLLLDMADRLEQNEEAPERDLGQRLLQEVYAKGLDWQDALNLVYDVDVAAVKAVRGRRREAR